MSEEKPGLPAQKAAPWSAPSVPAVEGAPSIPPAPLAPEAPVPAPVPAIAQESGEGPATSQPTEESSEKQADAIDPVPAPIISAEPEVEQEEWVAVNVPNGFNLRLDYEKVKPIKAGAQKMLRVDAEHWYSKANGVVII